MKRPLPFLALLCLLLSQMKAQTWTPVSQNQLSIAYQFIALSVVDGKVVWTACIDQGYTTPMGANHFINVFVKPEGDLTPPSSAYKTLLGKVASAFHLPFSETLQMQADFEKPITGVFGIHDLEGQ